jgi:hypothetical protein
MLWGIQNRKPFWRSRTLGSTQHDVCSDLIKKIGFFKFSVIFSVKPLAPACSHAHSHMSSRRNFRNPTHGSEVVNATRFAPLAPRRGLGLAGPNVPKIPQKFHQIAQNKQGKSVRKNIFGKICLHDIFGSKFLFRQSCRAGLSLPRRGSSVQLSWSRGHNVHLDSREHGLGWVIMVRC